MPGATDNELGDLKDIIDVIQSLNDWYRDDGSVRNVEEALEVIEAAQTKCDDCLDQVDCTVEALKRENQELALEIAELEAKKTVTRQKRRSKKAVSRKQKGLEDERKQVLQELELVMQKQQQGRAEIESLRNELAVRYHIAPVNLTSSSTNIRAVGELNSSTHGLMPLDISAEDEFELTQKLWKLL